MKTNNLIVVWTPYFGGRGFGGGVRENNAFCFLLRMDNLHTFIHNGGIWKVTIQPRLKMVLLFLLRKSFTRVQCSNECMLSWEEVTQWSATMSWVCTDLLSQEKSRFDDSCFYRNMTLGQSAYDTNLNCFLFKWFISKPNVIGPIIRRW